MRPILEVARTLAESHRNADNRTTIVKYFQSANNDKIRLLEVSDSVPTTNEILPYSFGAAPAEGIDYPSTVILISPTEWQSIQQGQLTLPPDWQLHQAQHV